MKFSTVPAEAGTTLISGHKKMPVFAWSIGVSNSGSVVSTSPVVLGDTVSHLQGYAVLLPDERVVTKQTNHFGIGEYQSYDSITDFKTNYRSNPLCQ